MGKYKRILDRMLELQDTFYIDTQPYLEQGRGKVGFLEVKGIDGESLMIAYDGDRIRYAREDENPTEHFMCSADTFLDLVSDPRPDLLREKVTKGAFVIRDAKTGEVSLIEMERWSRGFAKLSHVIKNVIGLI